jgi:uncharacterized integral membrane protein
MNLGCGVSYNMPLFLWTGKPSLSLSQSQKIVSLGLHSIPKKKYYGKQALLQNREGENVKNPKVIAGLAVGVLFVIFLFQNMDDVALRVYFWQVSMPKIIVAPLAILVGFVAGFVVAKLTGKPRKPKTGKDLQDSSLPTSGPSSPSKEQGPSRRS